MSNFNPFDDRRPDFGGDDMNNFPQRPGRPGSPDSSDEQWREFWMDEGRESNKRNDDRPRRPKHRYTSREDIMNEGPQGFGPRGPRGFGGQRFNAESSEGGRGKFKQNFRSGNGGPDNGPRFKQKFRAEDGGPSDGSQFKRKFRAHSEGTQGFDDPQGFDGPPRGPRQERRGFSARTSPTGGPQRFDGPRRAGRPDFDGPHQIPAPPEGFQKHVSFDNDGRFENVAFEEGFGPHGHRGEGPKGRGHGGDRPKGRRGHGGRGRGDREENFGPRKYRGDDRPRGRGGRDDERGRGEGPGRGKRRDFEGRPGGHDFEGRPGGHDFEGRPSRRDFDDRRGGRREFDDRPRRRRDGGDNSASEFREARRKRFNERLEEFGPGAFALRPDDDITGEEIPKYLRKQLRGLQKENADRVSKHLAMADRNLEVDPRKALQHAMRAVETAGRIAPVREAAGLTAYSAGEFKTALSELRTHRRMSGSQDHIALIADALRGVGKPDKAIELAQESLEEDLPREQKVDLTIVLSGAHSDKEEHQEAKDVLEIPELDDTKAFPFSPRLFRAYAEALEELKNQDDTETGELDDPQKWHDAALKAEKALGIVPGDSDIVDLLDEDDEEVPATAAADAVAGKRVRSEDESSEEEETLDVEDDSEDIKNSDDFTTEDSEIEDSETLKDDEAEEDSDEQQEETDKQK